MLLAHEQESSGDVVNASKSWNKRMWTDAEVLALPLPLHGSSDFWEEQVLEAEVWRDYKPAQQLGTPTQQDAWQLFVEGKEVQMIIIEKDTHVETGSTASTELLSQSASDGDDSANAESGLHGGPPGIRALNSGCTMHQGLDDVQRQGCEEEEDDDDADDEASSRVEVPLEWTSRRGSRSLISL